MRPSDLLPRLELQQRQAVVDSRASLQRALVAFLERGSTPQRPELALAALRAIENNITWFRLIGVINDERAPTLQARVTRPPQTAIISAKVGGLITIGTYGTRDEAEVVQGLLASAGIEAEIRADDAGGAFPFVLSGGAQVLVDESDAAAASELLTNRADES